MKLILFISFTILLVSCQESVKKEVKIIPPDLNHPWFIAEKINENTWRITDQGLDNCYLVTGTESALLIDNGVGAVDIISFIKRLTPLPLSIINTHGHPDHVGSNNQFDTAYAHPSNFAAIKNFTNRTVQKEMLKYMVRLPIPDSIKFIDTDSTHYATLIPIGDGHYFDLGDRDIEIIFTPGHTPGSICLLDKKNRVLFTGDHIKLEAWLHLEESLPLEVYLQSLQKIQKRAADFDILLPGHDSTLNKDFLQEQIICTENIISGKCVGQKYESVVGPGLLCNYKRARISYSPAKIKSM